MSRPFTGIVSCTFSTRLLTSVTSTSREIVPGKGVSAGATMGGGGTTGCGPGEFWACTSTDKAIVTATRNAAALLRWNNEYGIQILGNAPPNLSRTMDDAVRNRLVETRAECYVCETRQVNESRAGTGLLRIVRATRSKVFRVGARAATLLSAESLSPR